MPKILAGPKPGEKLFHEMFGGVSSQKLVLSEGVDAAGKPTGVYAKGIFGKADEPTGNNRIYPKQLLQREIAALQKQINEKGGIIGELDHPADGNTQLKRVSHVVTKLELQDNGDVYGEAKILDTEFGKTLKEIVKAGCATGVSSRGKGSVMINEHGQEVVQEDFHLVTYDFVAEPASASAYPTFMLENKNRREADMAEAEKKPLTLEDLKANHAPLVESIQTETKKAAEEAFAKRIAEVRAEERNLAKEDLREAFKTEILATLGEQRAEIEKQVRSEVMSDPKVAKAQKVMETIKTVLRPLITDEDISAVVKEKDEEITKLKAQIAEGQKAREEALAESGKLRDELKKLQEQIGSVEDAARDMGYKLFLERSMQGMSDEEKKLAMNFVGDLKAIKTADDLKARCEDAKSRAKAVLAETMAKKDAVKKTFEEIEKEVAKLEAENAALKAESTKLTEGMERAVGAAKSLGLKAYAERAIAENPRRPEIRKLMESKNFTSKEEVDKFVATLSEERRTSDDFRRIREGLAKGTGRTEKEATTVTESKNELMGVSVSEMRRLSGLGK